MKLKSRKKIVRRQHGQAIVEYVILVVVVALAALLVLTAFSDRIREMIAGVTNTLSNEKKADAGKSSLELTKELSADGFESESGN